METFSSKLIHWYRLHHRKLPWRETTDPYKIWLSEIILQQTRIEQGLSYYQAFVTNYPTIGELAKASEQEVLKLWQGLGYYSRARNLHHTARYIVKELGGEFPQNYQDLLKLKGVGPYTAAAIASFAYNEAVPAIDGNVYRLLSRCFLIETPINTPKALKEFKAIGTELLRGSEAALFNQATMELGATVCKPTQPFCTKCPVAPHCLAYEQKRQTEFPVKLKKNKVVERHFQYFIVKEKDQLILHKREGKGIWQNLYEPVLLEKAQPSQKELGDFLKKELNLTSFQLRKRNNTPILHKLSHQHIQATFWEVLPEEQAILSAPYRWVRNQDLSQYPFPKIVADALKADL